MPPTFESSRFGDSDPTDTTLPPFLWVPGVFLFVACLVFISLRRAQSREIWNRLTAYYHQHPLFGKRPGGIRLAVASAWRARRVRAGGNAAELDSEEDGASSEDDDLDDLDDNADELPATSPQPRPSLPQLASKGIRTALDALGWTGAGGGGGAGGPHSDAGIARAFWGLRKKDQRGGIRLGDDDEASPGGAAAARRQRKPLELVRPAPLVERIPAVPSSPRGPPQSPRASSSPTLFDLGEEEEEQDAVELAHEFKLEDHPLGDGARWGDGGGKRGPPQVVGSVKSMQRLA